MNSPSELTLEQEFELRMMLMSINKLDREQMQAYLIEATRQLMLKDNWIRHMFKKCFL